MRRVLSLLLTVAMMLSLVVVAGAEQQTVTLKTAKSVNGNEVTYTFTLDASKSDGVGALSFYVATTGLTFKEKVYNNGGTELDKVFKPSTVGQDGQDGAYGFYENMGRFYAYGGDYEANRLLKGTVVLVAVTYTIEDVANYSLEVTEFKACYSGARAMTEDKYNCAIADIDDGGSGTTGVTVSGTVTSFGGETDTVTVELWKADATSAAYQTTVTGNSAAYAIENVESGSYTMKVAKTKHATREYAVTVGSSDVTQDAVIWLYGDVNGSGVVDGSDATQIYRYRGGKKGVFSSDDAETLAYRIKVANITAFSAGDSVVDGSDATQIYRYRAGKASVFTKIP